MSAQWANAGQPTAAKKTGRSLRRRKSSRPFTRITLPARMTTQSFSAVHIMLPSPKRQARALQKHLAISPIPLPSVAAP
jgi:hypothetical protein